MFDRIASGYDRLNRVMTLGMDKSWRKAMSQLLPDSIEHWLDAATGTGDQILFAMQKGTKAKKVTGIDLSTKMLKIGQKKLKNFENVFLEHGSITEIPFNNATFDVITCSFGIRNVETFDEALCEFHRVLQPNGTLLILESSRPKHHLLDRFHTLYMKKVLPLLAKAFKSDPNAYSYLAETTSAFPSGLLFCEHLKKAGFTTLSCKKMAFGSVTLYHAKKT